MKVQVKVYHHTSELAKDYRGDTEIGVAAGLLYRTSESNPPLFILTMGYVHVADVEVDLRSLNSLMLGRAFQLTNHIDQEWWLNEGVTLVKESRSTSVGDIFIIGNETFIVEPVGYLYLGAY